jgi:hypothetical protein
VEADSPFSGPHPPVFLRSNHGVYIASAAGHQRYYHFFSPAGCLSKIHSALENGKESVQLNKVLQVTACLGIEIHAQFRGWKARDTQV